MLLSALNNSAPPGCQPRVHTRKLFLISLMYLLLFCPLSYLFLMVFLPYLIILLRCFVRELTKSLETRNAHLHSPITNLMMDMLLCTFLHVMIMIVIFTALLRNLVSVEAGLQGNHANTTLNLSFIKPDNK